MRNETKKRIRFLSWIAFILYLLVLVYLLFLAESYGRKSFVEREYRYNLVPFQEIHRFWYYRHQIGLWRAFLNLAGNVIGFLPFGFILPILGRRFRKGSLITLLGFSTSLMVETVQLISKVGIFDVDDLILNTLGAACGYLGFWICDLVRRWYYEKKI